jgi:tetratricopeptide (TPR) repeat protein
MLREAAGKVVQYQRLAGERRQAGDLEDAEQLYRRALALAERDLPADDLTTARVRNDLGVLLKYTGGFQEAAALYERSRAVLVAMLCSTVATSGWSTPNLATRTARDRS